MHGAIFFLAVYYLSIFTPRDKYLLVNRGLFDPQPTFNLKTPG